MTKKIIQTKKLYGKIEIQAEEKKVTGVVEEKTVQVHVEVRVNSEIYTKDVTKACNLTETNEIKNKRSVLPWDLRRVKILKKLNVRLQKGGEKKTITLTVNKLDSSLEKIASSVLALKKLEIDGAEWIIENVVIVVLRQLGAHQVGH